MLRIGDVVEAVVAVVEEAGAVVRWENGEGWLPRDEAPEELQEGQRLLLKVISQDTSGRPVLSRRQVTETDRELHKLRREAERMRRFLRERRLSPPERSSRPRETPVEERLRKWILEAERALERLRRRRARFGLRG